MDYPTVEVPSLKVKFTQVLTLVDKAIKLGLPLQIRQSWLSQTNTKITFLKWLHKHEIIELRTIEEPIKKKVSVRSRSRKIEIALQLKALNSTIADIAKKFNVKSSTAKGYLKSLGKYDKTYLDILKMVLELRHINKDTPLQNFPVFPIRTQANQLKEHVGSSDYKRLEVITKSSIWMKFTAGQNLGTFDLAILLPEKI